MLEGIFYVTLNTNPKILHSWYLLINCPQNPRGPVFWVHWCHHPLFISTRQVHWELQNYILKIELQNTTSTSSNASTPSSSTSRRSRKRHFSVPGSEFTYTHFIMLLSFLFQISGAYRLLVVYIVLCPEPTIWQRKEYLRLQSLSCLHSKDDLSVFWSICTFSHIYRLMPRTHHLTKKRVFETSITVMFTQ